MKLVFLVEEPSMKSFLEVVLPRMLPPETAYQVIPHQGKTDLEQSIPRKLRAWQEPDARFVILRDQDSAPCLEVKAKLQELCKQGYREDTLVRIVCRELAARGGSRADGNAVIAPRGEERERRNTGRISSFSRRCHGARGRCFRSWDFRHELLESWLLGDLAAVARAFNHPTIAALANKAKFKDPDRLTASHVLTELIPGYGKIHGARAIGAELDLDACRSESFRQFRSGLERLLQPRG